MNCSQCSIYKNVVLNVPCDCRVCPAQPGIAICGNPCHFTVNNNILIIRFSGDSNISDWPVVKPECCSGQAYSSTVRMTD